MAKRKGGLGRGLDALFADAAPLFEEDLEQNEEENIDTKLLDIIDGVTGDKSRERFATKNKSKSNSIHKTKLQFLGLFTSTISLCFIGFRCRTCRLFRCIMEGHHRFSRHLFHWACW